MESKEFLKKILEEKDAIKILLSEYTKRLKDNKENKNMCYMMILSCVAQYNCLEDLQSFITGDFAAHFIMSKPPLIDVEKLIKENVQLKAQNEKMKCCENCKKHEAGKDCKELCFDNFEKWELATDEDNSEVMTRDEMIESRR